MPNRSRLYTSKLTKPLVKRVLGWPAAFWRRSHWHKALTVLVLGLGLAVAGMYGISRWYMASQSHKLLVVGTTFIPAYAESLGLDAKQTLDALQYDLGVRHFRLVSYWNQLEPAPGQYDFGLLDWQFEKAEQAGSTVTLSIGLRQPRWPECHVPHWAANMPKNQWEPLLMDYIAATVNRYKDSPALGSYQLENEFLLANFGHCTDFDQGRLQKEFNLVKRLDPNHPVIISRSNNTISWPVEGPKADIVGMSVYRTVWEGRYLNRYFTYPMPAWYYGFLAGVQKAVFGQESMLHELQAEPWPPGGRPLVQTPAAELDKSFSAAMLPGRVEFGRATGMREMYLWGSEYWYYRKMTLNDDGLWKEARDIFRQSDY